MFAYFTAIGKDAFAPIESIFRFISGRARTFLPDFDQLQGVQEKKGTEILANRVTYERVPGSGD